MGVNDENTAAGGENGTLADVPDPSLARARRRLEAIASPSGEYVLRCSKRGDRPVPATDLRFESIADARRAARIVASYRDHLRRYDHRTPHYDLAVVHQSPDTRPRRRR